MPDAHKNFAYSTVTTAPSPDTTGTSLVVETGDGTKFPTPPFNATVWPVGDQPLTTNAEIVRVTAIAGDTFTITRTQEGTTARAIVVGDQIAATITAKTLTDVETVIGCRVRRTTALSVPTAAWTTMPLDAEDFDTDGMHDNAVNNTRVTINTAGKYQVIIETSFLDAAAGTTRGVRWKKNGVVQREFFIGPDPEGRARFTVSLALIELGVADYLEFEVYQNRGAALDGDMFVSVHRVGT